MAKVKTGINIYIDGVKHNRTPRPLSVVNYHIDDWKAAGESFELKFKYAYDDGSESAFSVPQNKTLSVGPETFNYNQDVVLIYDGNSLTTDSGGASHATYTKEFFETKFNSLLFENHAVSGTTINTMHDNAPTNIYPKAQVGKTNFIVMWEDYNGLLGSFVNAVSQWDLVTDYFNNCRTNGYDHLIYIIGYHPREHGEPAAAMTQRDIFFQRVIDTPIADCAWDYLIDMREDRNMGGDHGQLKNTYFADVIHPTTLGDQTLAEHVKRTILDIIKT